MLPWSKCDPSWSTEDCVTPEISDMCLELNLTYFKNECLNSTQLTAMNLTIENITAIVRKPPAEEYFK